MEIELRRHVTSAACMLLRNFATIRESGARHIESRSACTATGTTAGSATTRSTAARAASTTLATLRRLGHRHTYGDGDRNRQHHYQSSHFPSLCFLLRNVPGGTRNPFGTLLWDVENRKKLLRMNRLLQEFLHLRTMSG